MSFFVPRRKYPFALPSPESLRFPTVFTDEQAAKSHIGRWWHRNVDQGNWRDWQARLRQALIEALGKAFSGLPDPQSPDIPFITEGQIDYMPALTELWEKLTQGGPTDFPSGAEYITQGLRGGGFGAGPGGLTLGRVLGGGLKSQQRWRVGDFVTFDYRGRPVKGAIRDIDERGQTAWIMNRDPDTPKMGDGQTTVVFLKNLRPQ